MAQNSFETFTESLAKSDSIGKKKILLLCCEETDDHDAYVQFLEEVEPLIASTSASYLVMLPAFESEPICIPDDFSSFEEIWFYGSSVVGAVEAYTRFATEFGLNIKDLSKPGTRLYSHLQSLAK